MSSKNIYSYVFRLRKKGIRKKLFIFLSLALIITSFIGAYISLFGDSQIFHNKHMNSEMKNNSNITHYPKLKASTITTSGSGYSFPVFIHALQTSSITSNLQDDLSVNLKGLTAYRSILNFSNLEAENYTKIIENYVPDGNTDLADSPSASFVVPTDCFLRYIEVNVSGNTSITSYVRIYNSTWNQSKNRSELDVSIYEKQVYSDDLIAGLVYMDDLYLNASMTDNNTFFVVMFVSVLDAGNVFWNYVDDTTNGDNSYSYYIPLSSRQYQTVDYIFNVSLSFARAPTPENLSLAVNSTQVSNNYTWQTSEFFSTAQIYFNVSSIWPFVNYNVTYYIYENQTMFSDSQYSISSSDSSATWIVNFSTSIPIGFTNLNATFYPPTDWTYGFTKNGSLLYPYVESSPGYVRIRWNHGNGDWFSYFTSPNYFSELIVSPLEALITQNISFSAKFITTISDPEGAIDIYHDLGSTSTLVKTIGATPNQNWMNTSWIPSSDIDFTGNFTAYARWNNGTEVGLVQANFYLKYQTVLLSLFDETKNYLIGDIIEVRVYYADIYHSPSQPITGADVTGSWIYNNSFKFLDEGNGYYVSYINTSNAQNGTYVLTVFAKKFGYQEQQIALNISLIYKTRLESNDYIANYTIPITIRANYLLDNGTPIIGADVFINGTRMKDNLNGTYTYTVSFVILGTYNYIINASKPGFQSKNITISVTVSNISTYLEGQSAVLLEYISSATISVTYKMFNGTLISTASASLQINGTKYPIKEISPGVYGVIIQQNFTIGTYNLTFHLEKYGFAPATFYTILEITPASTSANTADGNLNYSITYHYTLSVSVNYTLANGSLIEDAYVYAVPSYNTSKIITFTYTPSGYYNTSIYIDYPKNFTLFVHLQHYQYENKTLQISIFVIPRNVSYNLNAPLNAPAGSEFNLTFQLIDQLSGEPLTNASILVSVTGNNSLVNIKIFAISDRYVISVIVNNKPSTNTTVTFTISSYLLGFKNVTSFDSVYVYCVKTNATIRYSSRIPIGENISVFITYGPTNAKIITNWSYYEITNFLNGSYSVLFNTSSLNYGTYTISLLIYQENYVNYSTIITFEITKLPTQLLIEYERVILWNDTLVLNVSLIDVFHQQPIDNFSLSLNSSVSYKLFNYGYYYIVKVFTVSLTPGSYSLIFNASRTNCENASLVILFEVSPRYAKILFPPTIYYYVNNTISLNITLIDANSSKPVTNANLVLSIFDKSYTLTEASNGVYRTQLFLSSIGTFEGTILFSKENYYSTSYNFTLIVKNRSSVIFFISTLGDPIAGSSIGVNITAVYNNGSVASGIPITVKVEFKLENGSTIIITKMLTTNENGQAIFDVEIPANALSMNVTVLHQGLISTITSEKTVRFSVSKSFNLLDYWWIFVLFAMTAVSTYFIYNTRRKRIAVKLAEQIKTKELYAELASIRHYLLIHNSGVLMYYKNYATKELQADLLSGLITALTTVSSQILETKEKSRYSIHTYSGLVITVVHGDFVMAAFVSEKPLSIKMINRAYYILKLLERRYKDRLAGWGGDLDSIKPFAVQFEQELAIPLVHLEIELTPLKGKYSPLYIKMKRLHESGTKLTIANLVKTFNEKEITLLHELLMMKKIQFKVSKNES